MIRKNLDIRFAARAEGIALWRIAERLGVCELTLQRWLREDLAPERKAKMLKIIKELSGKR